MGIPVLWAYLWLCVCDPQENVCAVRLLGVRSVSLSSELQTELRQVGCCQPGATGKRGRRHVLLEWTKLN